MGRRQQLTDHLAGVPLFAACAKGDLKILARHMVEVEVPEGATVVSEGERADAFYVVLEGEAVVSVGAARKTRRNVAKLGVGSWFGELAVLDPAPRNATVAAATPMVLGVLGARVFRAVLRDVPSLTEKLLAGMARRLRDADRVVNELDVAPRSASSRKSAAAHAPRPRRPQRTGRSAGSRAR
jgi:CRP/FNR family transcriptional regulator, cyclic AMP receptor protein